MQLYDNINFSYKFSKIMLIFSSYGITITRAASKSQEHIFLPHFQVERDTSVSDFFFKMLAPILLALIHRESIS